MLKVFQKSICNSYSYVLAFLLLLSPQLNGATAHKFSIEPTNINYYLASLVGESKYYAPTFYDDYLVKIDEKNIFHMTKLNGEVIDFYFYASPKEIGEHWPSFMEKRKTLDQFSQKIFPALEKYRKTNPNFPQKDLYKKVSKIIKKVTKTTTEVVVGDREEIKIVDKALFHYLKSNGIEKLSDIKQHQEIIKMLVNKFYMLSTTYFYRGYSNIKVFKEHLNPLYEKATQESRPLKIKVFACSTGEEAVTYAIELLEQGISNFTILASDINDSSLKFAEEMAYSFSSFNRLPFSIQKKLRKYFSYNSTSGLWEIKEKDFFQERVKFINQNILEKIPSTLDEKFSPPYDLVSILNVLFYLDDSAIQAKKDYWASLLNEDGILILKDSRYSLLRGTMGPQWAFEQFFMLNEWVNIKKGPQWPPEKRITFYKENYEKDPSENNLLVLTNSYLLMNEGVKAQELLTKHLETNPYSYQALLRLAGPAQALTQETKTELFDKLSRFHLHNIGAFNKIIDYEKSASEKAYLNHLKTVYQNFSKIFKKSPQEAKALFDFSTPTTKKYDNLRRLIKSNAYSLLLEYHFEKEEAQAVESIAKEGLSILENLITKTPEYIEATRYLYSILHPLFEQYVNKGKYKEILTLSNKWINILRKPYQDQNYYFAQISLGNLYLNKAMALQKLTKNKNTVPYLNTAIAHFNRVNPINVDMSPLQLVQYYGNLAHSHMLKGQNCVKKSLAKMEFKKSMALFEKALEVNALYVKWIPLLQEELKELSDGVKSSERRSQKQIHHKKGR